MLEPYNILENAELLTEQIDILIINRQLFKNTNLF